MTKWTKQYNNDTGPDDDYFEEWFEITDGKRIFRCEESEDADFLLSILSQQAEPVAWITEWEGEYSSGKILDYIAQTRGGNVKYTPLYTSTPPRQPLSDEQIAELMMEIWSCDSIAPRNRSHRLARAIEAAHGIKENT